jgi:LacI family transcriptional regulator
MPVTLKDIALQAGVSVTTVSRVINYNDATICGEEMQRNIRELAKQLGYKPRGKSENDLERSHYRIGYVLYTDSLSDPYYSLVVRGIESEALRLGAKLVFGCFAPDLYNAASFQKLVEQSQAEAIIYLNGIGELYADTSLGDKQHIVMAGMEAGYLAKTLPVDERRSYDYVGVDFFNDTLHWLVHKLFKRVARAGYIGPEKSMRYSAFVEAHRLTGRPLDRDAIAFTDDFKVESGKAAMLRLLRHKENLPDACFAACDTLAIGALQAIKESGLRVPEDMKLLGFDNIEMAGFVSPPLTTIEIPMVHIGRAAVKAAVERITGERDYPIRLFLPTTFVDRESL